MQVLCMLQAGFFQSVQVLLDPQDEEQRKTANDLFGESIVNRWWRHGDSTNPALRQAVVAFLRYMSIMTVQHELGRPLTTLSEANIVEYYAESPQKAPGDAVNQLREVHKQYHNLLMVVQDLSMIFRKLSWGLSY